MDQVRRCCFCFGRRNFPPGHVARAASSTERHDRASPPTSTVLRPRSGTKIGAVADAGQMASACWWYLPGPANRATAGVPHGVRAFALNTTEMLRRATDAYSYANTTSLHRPRPVVACPRGSDVRPASTVPDVADGRNRHTKRLGENCIGFRRSSDGNHLLSGELCRPVLLASAHAAHRPSPIAAIHSSVVPAGSP